MFKTCADSIQKPICGAIALLAMATALAAQSGAPAEHNRAQLAQTYLQLPLSFEPNQGQTEARVKFTAHGPGYTLFLTGDQAVLRLNNAQANAPRGEYRGRSDVLRMRFVGASGEAAVSGLDELPGKSNFFLGSDPRQWRTEVPNYRKVSDEDLYQGVDLVYYGNQRQLEYDFVLAPGADPSLIGFKLDRMTTGRRGRGAEWIELGSSRRQGALRINPDGDLIVPLDGREAVLRKPVAYQNGPTRRLVDARYVLRPHRRIGFQLGSYDRRRPLVIDPVLTYSTFLGGSGNDFGVSIAVDSSGNAYVAGGTTSSNFPAVSAAQSTYGGAGSGTCATFAFECGDAFVSKINASGSTLLYSTYLGGSGNDTAFGIALDSSGDAYVAGETYSTNFPTTSSAYQKILGGTSGAFVTKLSSSGSSLTYSTYLSGNTQDIAAGIAVDSSGNAYVAGRTRSTNFPVTLGDFQHSLAGGLDGFVTKLNSTGSALSYSTYLGGTLDDALNGIAIDSSGNAYVSGQTLSTDFPIMNAYQSASGGGSAAACGAVVCGDAILAKLNPSGSALLYSTYLGGSGEDTGLGLAVDASGNAYMVGGTTSTDFPVTYNAPQSTYGGGSSACAIVGLACGDAFVVKVNTLASGAASLVSSTYFGGGGDDLAWGVALDSAGHIHVSGGTDSEDFLVTGDALQSAYGGGTASCTVNKFCGDAFVLTLTNAGSAVMYSSYLGGSGDEFGTGLAVSSSGAAYLTGGTLSTNFPATTGAYNTSCSSCGSGASDAFVSVIGGTNVLPLAEAPTLNVDFDGDGLADFAIWRPGTDTWWLDSGAGIQSQIYGLSGDVPVAADFDGDGKSDIGLWRPSNGTWYYISSQTGSAAVPVQWGLPGDIPVPANYDGDGKADFAVWRPSNGTWYYLSGATATRVQHTVQWGLPGDVPVPGDYDGDGKADFAVWRPSTGTWYYVASSTGQRFSYQWGAPGDIPVPGDYDGDGKTDFAVWRPSTGTWYIVKSSTGTTASQQWGISGDIPVAGDYNGDGKNDYAVWRPSNGTWYFDYTSGGTSSRQWGEAGDIPATYLGSMIRRDKHIANFDGDRKTDLAVWRPSNGTWYVISSMTGMGAHQQWGMSGDVPAPGDYDGDSKTDYAVWRPSTGTWYVIFSSTGTSASEQWGTNGDVAVPGDYDGDGKTDYAVWRPSTGTWYVMFSSTGTSASRQWGATGDIPVPGDYDGDGKTDYAVWRPSNGTWYVIFSSTGTSTNQQWGTKGDVPVPGDYDGDTKTDFTVFRPSTGTWYTLQSSNGQGVRTALGVSTDIPVARDYDGDEKTDVAVWRPSNGTWYILQSSDGKEVTTPWGASTDIPVNRPAGRQ
ncbi:MAG TPA: SBBP repeat-containing protein [Terriglobia bacterium]|nr:SBBP repeat-containing protein [Terriglobia bacterium]